MRTLVISDLHLNHRNFSQKRLDYLINLINRFDDVILNGDLWCAFSSSFDQFYKSKWQPLFKHLKEHNCIYIEGNHDLKKYCDDRIFDLCNLFTEKYHFKRGDLDLNFLHGHQLVRNNKKGEFETKIRRLTYIESVPQWLEFLAVTMLGYERFSKLISRLVNRVQKNSIRKRHSPVASLTIVSHSHGFEDKRLENFINTGRIGKTYASYLAIYENTIESIVEKY